MTTTTDDLHNDARVRRTFFQVARQPRTVAMLVVFLIIAAACVLLGNWQLNRAHLRAHLAAQQQRAEADAGGARPLSEFLAPQQTFPGELVGRSVTVTGVYEPEGQLYVTDRTVNGRQGYLVLTPLRVTDDGSGGESWASLSGAPVLPVVRGWVADLDDAADLEVPGGTVHLTVYLQSSEQAGAAPDAEGRLPAISSAQLLTIWTGPIYSGYGVVSASAPAQSSELVALPRPVIDGGDGLNVRNVFYAIEWWIFGAFAILLWARLVRDEMHGGRDPLAVSDPLAVPETD